MGLWIYEGVGLQFLSFLASLRVILITRYLSTIVLTGLLCGTYAQRTRAATTLTGWGETNSGQLSIPASLGEVVSAAGGLAHSLALTTSGKVLAWGDNGSGQTNVPPALDNVVGISSLYKHSLALRVDGSVVAWGSMRNVPSDVRGATVVSAGGHHNLALLATHQVIEWNSSGVIRINSSLSFAVVSVSAGLDHSLALDAGRVVAWGDNTYGQCAVPPDLQGVVAIAAGYTHSLALRGDGIVFAWGANGQHQSDVPPGLRGVIAIAAGAEHSMALRRDGTVIAWGTPVHGATNVPTTLSDVSFIASGADHCLAITGRRALPAVAFEGIASLSGMLALNFQTERGHSYFLETVLEPFFPGSLVVVGFPGDGAPLYLQIPSYERARFFRFRIY